MTDMRLNLERALADATPVLSTRVSPAGEGSYIRELFGAVPASEIKTEIRGVDPKGAAGAAKLPLGALPWAVIFEASLGMGEGAVKYGPHNWRSSGGVQTMTYVEAAQRHLGAFILGEDIDPASQIHHVTKAITSLMVLRDAMINGCAVDNRPLSVNPLLVETLTQLWGEVRTRADAERLRLEAVSA